MKQINFKNLWKALLIIIIYIFILPEIVTLGFNKMGLSLSNKTYYVIANLTIYTLILLILIMTYHKDLKNEALIFKKNWKKNLKTGFKYWILAYGFMIICNMIIISINGDIATNESANRNVINAMPYFSFISMALFGPIIEELIFRKGFKNAFNNPTFYLIVSSLLFGSGHMIALFTQGANFAWTQLLYIISYGGIGFFFAKAYLETDTIFTSIIMHIFHNSLAVILVLLMGGL